MTWRDAVGVLFREFGQYFELTRVQSAERNLDALHAGRIPQQSQDPLCPAEGTRILRVSTPSWRCPLSYRWPYAPRRKRVSANTLSSILPFFFRVTSLSKISSSRASCGAI